jgi:hypothetical protein
MHSSRHPPPACASRLSPSLVSGLPHLPSEAAGPSFVKHVLRELMCAMCAAGAEAGVLCPVCKSCQLVQRSGLLVCPAEGWRLNLAAESMSLEDIRARLATAYEVRPCVSEVMGRACMWVEGETPMFCPQAGLSGCLGRFLTCVTLMCWHVSLQRFWLLSC